MLQLKMKKLNPDNTVPAYAHPGDAGMDLFAGAETAIAPGERVVVPTGIAMEIPDGHAGLIWDKSGIATKYGLVAIAGVIDAGYRGEVKVAMINLSREPHTFQKGDKVAQMLIQKIENPEIAEVSELSNTARGEGGFGSTGE